MPIIQQLKSSPQRAVTIATVLFTTLVVVGSLVLADKYLRLQNIQACLNLAQNRTTTTGRGDGGEWSVQEVAINAAVYQECLSKKDL